MSHPKFEDLPFYERPDLTPYLIHLTKNTEAEDEYSAFDNLVNILQTGKIWATKTFIKGPNPAACFMDVPFYSLKYILNKENTDPENPRYEPFGVFVTKRYAYLKGCRPVLYLSDEEVQRLEMPDSELWRVVRLELSDTECISWLHEREWRAKGDFGLPWELDGVLVHNPDCAKKLQTLIANDASDFKAKPRSIIPLTVLCQGLPLMHRG
ncbi:MAG: hypothetical protein ACREBU_21165 [Nitrososphaera sp.]